MFARLRNNVLIENIFSLTILNGLNLLLPLITIPYLIATVGSANYGAYSIAYTIVQYVLLLSTFGFSYTSTKQIAQQRNDISQVARVFYSTIFARLLLTILGSIICFIVVEIFFPKYIILYLLGLGIVFGDSLNAVWFFQGMENMKYITITNGITKIVFTLLIFVCVRQESDYVYIILLNSIGFISGGVVSFIIAHKVFPLRYSHISVSDVVYQIKEGFVVFCSSAFVNLFNNSFILILGLFLQESAVGIYAAVDKIIKAAKLLVDPISNALFPHMASKFVGNRVSDNVARLLGYGKKLFILLLFITVMLFILAPLCCDIFLNSIKDESTYLLRIMSPLVILGGLNYILGMVGLINLGEQKTWLRNLFISSLTGVLIILVTVKTLGTLSAVISSMCTESLLLFLTLGKLLKLKRTT